MNWKDMKWSKGKVYSITGHDGTDGTPWIGGWVGPRDDLNRCGNSRPHRELIPGPSSPYRVAIPTTLPGP
jgi:hypothetical protein